MHSMKIFLTALWLYNWLLSKWIIFFSVEQNIKFVICGNPPLSMQQIEIMLKNADVFLQIQMRLSVYKALSINEPLILIVSD